jgi:DNA-binding transcriptional LysR family regulator
MEVQNSDVAIGDSDNFVPGKDLEVHHCRVLVAVDQHGGVAAAARALGLAQSTVSETLLSLERVLGKAVTLRRPGKEAALTATARTLLPHARTLISASEAALASLATKSPQILRLGTVESISSFVLPGPLRAFRQRWPHVDVRITTGLCDHLRMQVRRSELDAALTIESAERSNDGEASRILCPASLRLVVSKLSPLDRGVASRADLGLRRFLLADSGGAFNELLRVWFQNSPKSPKFESAGSIDGVKRGIRDSDAIGVLPAYAIAEELQSGSLVALRVREPLPAIALLLTTPAPVPEASPLHNLVQEIERMFDTEAV